MTPRRGSRNLQSPNAGFTLLELLIALGLMAAIMAAAFGGLRFGARLWEAGNVRAEAAGEFRSTYRVLRQLLASSQPLTLADESEPAYAFEGDSDELRFVAPVPVGAGEAGAYAIVLFTTRDREGQDLHLGWSRFDGDEEDIDEFESDDDIVLVRDIRDLRFAYFGTSKTANEPAWTDRWDDPDQLPRLVRLTIDKGGDGGVPWPELVMPIGSDMDVDCVFKDSTWFRKCRDDNT